MEQSILSTLCIFPVKNKRPLVKGWQQSTPIDLPKVEEWQAQFPACGWGVALDADVMVIDCDSPEALSQFTDQGEIPFTRTTFTPRGFHLWFHYPPTGGVRNRVGLMAGVDVRAKGGFVVVPPSEGYQFVDINAPIADAPEWILRLVRGGGGR